MSKRPSNLELPSISELWDMIQKESPRLAAKRDFLETHSSIFTEIGVVADRAGIDRRVLDEWPNMTFAETVDQVTMVVDVLSGYLADEKMWYNAESLYAPLAFHVPPQESEVIFVLGSSINARIDKAIELYRAGIAPKIMTTGRGPHWGNSADSEGQRQAEYAVAHGVPQNDIMIEDRSITTPDNVKRSVDMWLEMNWRPAHVTIVTSEFHLLREYMDMYKFSEWDMQLCTAAPLPSDELNVANWIKTEYGRRIILNEYAKLIIESKIDQVLMEEKK